MKPILPLVTVLCLALAGCAGSAPPARPELPLSISPGWSAHGFENSPAPDGLPAGEQPVCWKADYAGSGGAVATVWICGYAHGGAFDAMQRARAAANTVKFNKGRYLAIVRWNGGTRTDVIALMRGLEKALPE